MTASTLLSYLIAIVCGFLSGGIMFCQLLPKVIMGKDIQAISEDHNPGTTNVFVHCGPRLGFICLILDLAKGFIPIFLSCIFLDTSNLLFGIVMAAPVLGHAIAPFDHFHGGKCIATSFGELLALLPYNKVGLILAGLYIIFSTVIRMKSNREKSILVFSLFGLIASIILTHLGNNSIALGCVLISLTAIVKHSKFFVR